jgi:amidase
MEWEDGYFEEVDMAYLAGAMESGEVRSVDLTKFYLDRIARIDSACGLRAILSLNSQALDIAERLDVERDSGIIRGPLHGLPILLKGNIDSGDAMPTTAGSLALAGTYAGSDAPLVARLRAAGAVILGKTNMSEWANFRSTRSCSGWSAEGGQARNPYVLDRSPSGSSSGSGIAVSANFCTAAVGTETDGSIVSPGSANGIVGFKPTVGVIPGKGIIPISKSQDTAGPMARNVKDAALLLSAMKCPEMLPEINDARAVERLCDIHSARPLSGVRLGIARAFCVFHPGTDSLFKEALGALRDLGAELIESDLRAEPGFEEAEYEVLLYEFKAGIAEYLSGRRALVGTEGPTSLEDLILFNASNRDDELSLFGQDIFEAAQAKGSLNDEAYAKARAFCIAASRQRGIDAALAKDGLTGLIAPTGAPAWKIDHVLGDSLSGLSGLSGSPGISCSSLPAAAGYPHVTVPMGFVKKLPVGLSIFGAAYSDLGILRIAGIFETAIRARKRPEFISTLES